MNKYLKKILETMCQEVGADFEKMNFKQQDWFWEYSWTEGQEESFKSWLIDYLKENKEARYSLMNIPSSDKKILERFVNQFLLNYGWKLQ